MPFSVLSPLHLLHNAITSYLPNFSQPCSTSSENDEQFNLEDFDVTYNTGFLPSEHPLESLPEEFELWESALASARDCLSLGEDESAAAVAKRESSRRWRQALEVAPVLCTKSLQGDVSLLQRAHHVLAFLVHFYVHSIPPKSTNQIRVPAALAVPLVAVSEVLRIAPILTFADTVLWNYRLIDPSKPLSPTNMIAQTTFTGTTDEEKFYLCCASIEMQGVEALRVISDFQNVDTEDLDSRDIAKIASSLERVASVIGDLTTTLQSVRCGCDPHVFYDQIRPWFRGSDASGPNSPRWIYEGVPHSDKLELSGPSAGQSSMIHSLDVFFEVDHKLEHQRLPAPSEQNRRADHTFMTRMRRYMPGKHQQFLVYLASSPRSIRDLAIRESALQQSYNNCVLGLKKFRDAHLRIACLYVVSMSRATVALKAGCPVGAMMKKMEEEAAKRQPVRGTGGNELSLLLKACRDATTRTLLQ